jgi:branched-chain amino acid transport system permease protein
MGNVAVAIISGVAVGGTYALISLGLVLVFRATTTLNFAHGQFLVLAALIAGSLQLKHHVPVLAGTIIAGLIVAVIAVAFYRLVLQHLVGMPVFMPVIATMGLAAVLDGAIGYVFSFEQYSLRLPGTPTGAISILGARIGAEKVFVSLISFALAGLVICILRFTKIGIRVRASGQDASLASQAGINVHWLYMGSWAAAGMLAGVAGVLFASNQVVDASVVGLALAAFPAILLGGLDSIEGAVVGSLLIGLLQGFTVVYLGYDYVDVVSYVVLLVVVLFRPAGLFGSREVRRI